MRELANSIYLNAEFFVIRSFVAVLTFSPIVEEVMKYPARTVILFPLVCKRRLAAHV